MARIKVVFILNDFNVGGTSKVVYDMLQGYDYSRFEIVIILLAKGTSFLDSKNLDPSIKIHELNYHFDTSYSLRRYIKLSIFKKIIRARAAEIIEMVKKLSPDIVHFHTQPRELIIGRLIQKRLNKVKLVYTDHSFRIGTSEYSFLNRYLLSLVYKYYYWPFHTIAVSRGIMNCHKMFKWHNPSKKHTLIENRINFSSYPQKEYKKNDRLTVVYLARLSPVKQHDKLLKSWKKLSPQKLILKLIGGGELMEQIKNQIKNEKIENVLVKGDVQNVVEELLSSDIAVFTSSKEGLPIALIEKMAVGLPVIVNDIPQLTDFIEDKKTGLIFKDFKAFPALLMKLADSPDLREELGKAARESILSRFGNKSLGQENMEFYNQILK